MASAEELINDARNYAGEVLGSARAIDVLAERLAGYAESMVAGEARRRARQNDHDTA